MKALIFLYLLRIKGNIRNVFSKPSSAIFASFMILVYGGMFIGVVMNPGAALSMMNITAINSAIFVGLAFTAFMVMMMLMQSRKSLFMENDAFYLFSGPFKRSHAMQFIMSQSIVGAIFCGLTSLFLMVIFGAELEYSAIFLFLTFLSHTLVYFFFTILYYYVYLLSIKDRKYRHVSLYTMLFFMVAVAIIFVFVLAQNDFEIKNSAMNFLDSELFHYVPLFGWVKLMLTSFIIGEWLMVFLGFALLLASCVIIYLLMCNYKGEFVEKAMQDAIEFTKRYKEAKAGTRTSFKDKKIRNVSSDFKEGAAAIFSKTILQMKKTNTYISFQDIIFIGMYLVIAMIGDLGFEFFTYMMVFWLFITIQNSEFMREMNNYQIYLIPEKPLAKLLYLVAPYIMKYMILTLVPIFIGYIIMQPPLIRAVQNLIMLAGYACLFVSASVLATRVLKSRNNAMMENMLRMLIIIFASLPSLILILIIFNLNIVNMTLLTLLTFLPFVMNFVLSALILYGCRNMMNGREVKSD